MGRLSGKKGRGNSLQTETREIGKVKCPRKHLHLPVVSLFSDTFIFFSKPALILSSQLMILPHSRGGTSHQIGNTLVSHHQMYKSAHLFLFFSTPLWLKLGRIPPPFKGWPLQVSLGLCPSEYLSNLLHQFSPSLFLQLILSNVTFLSTPFSSHFLS